jgi:hypothetical protein
MAVKNIESKEVHKGYKGGKTEYGFDTAENPENWVSSTASITCAKDGCA